MASAMSVAFQNTIAAMTRLRPEARNLLRLGTAVGNPALFAGLV
jgi:hypothetical protein